MALPSIPESGLHSVLASWSGRGAIWDALAAPSDLDDKSGWKPRDLQMRVHRVLFERVVPFLGRWPTSTRAWLDLLPATNTRREVEDISPSSRVSWSDTRVRFGWPPKRFIGHQSARSAHTLPLTALRWTIEGLVTVAQDAQSLVPDLARAVRPQLQAAERLLDVPPVRAADALAPDAQELLAIRREGAPWGAVSRVAEELRLEESSVSLASQLLLPDEAIRWRLFHLAVLGELLIALKKAGCRTISIRPLGMSRSGPAYFVHDAANRTWELWFEAAGVWSHAGITAPYVEATRGMAGVERALGADLLLLLPGQFALAIECKYSASSDFVARNGYYQAATYASEIKSRLAETVLGIAVGPEEVVGSAAFTRCASGIVGVVPPSSLCKIVEDLLER